MGFRESLKRDLTDKTFSLSLPRCELRQCGVDEPRTYTGAGFVDQLPDGSLRLKMFATEELPEPERFDRLFPKSLTPGVLIPDSAYYDLTATDQGGYIWTAERQSIDLKFGAGNEVHATLRYLEKHEELPASAEAHGAAWFIPGRYELPWHQITKTDRSTSVDRFEFDDDSFTWKAHKGDGGLDVGLTVKQGELEPHATRFLRALSIVLGAALEPLYSYRYGGGTLVTRIHPPPRRVRSQLVGPLLDRIFEHEDAHRFLACCLHNAVQEHPEPQDQLEVIYSFWFRILRAHQEDIENSSLVVSVAIEGVAKTLFYSERDADPTFIALLDEERPKVEALEINERVKDSMLRSLENAAFPKPKDTLRRLVEQGAIFDLHVSAWSKMRNTGAHGVRLDDSNGKFQAHLNRYFICIDLFYRLMFVAIGYRGKHHDFSAVGWPEKQFPPT